MAYYHIAFVDLFSFQKFICEIGDQCYDHLEQSFDRSCLMCDVDKSTTGWTTQVCLILTDW